MNQEISTLQRQDESVQDKTPEKNGPSSLAMTDHGLRPSNLEEAWRYAAALSRSAFVPAPYQNKPDDCLIAIDMAQRLNVAPLMFLQNTYVVHGKPGMEAKLVIALVNASRLFVDPLDYEIEGDDPKDKGYRVRAFAARAKTGKVIYGPWITWAIVSAEGWDKKDGSKWKTIPSLMFVYRAAAWFSRQHCPEVTMGMMTLEELEDIEPRKQVDATVLNGKERSKFGFTKAEEPKEGQEPSKAKPSTRRKKAPSTPPATQTPAEPMDDTPEPESPAGGNVADLDDTPELDPDQMCICAAHGHTFKYRMAVFTALGRVCPICLDRLAEDNTDWRPMTDDEILAA